MAFTFLKTGAASAKLAQKAAAEPEARKQQGKMFRFWMKEKEEARITFVDGDLAKDGPLAGYPDPPRYYEHNLFLNGRVEQLLRLSGEDHPGRQRQVSHL